MDNDIIPATRPTNVRYMVLLLATMVAVLLYLDRICLGFAERYVKEDVGLTNNEMAIVLESFFWAYAVGQLPAGWLSDRFGARLMLTLFLAGWSALTGLLGLASTMVWLIVLRFGCGLFEAGAYPACAGVVSKWMPFERRGFASGIISVGGRLGGALAPLVTAYLIERSGWRPAMAIYGAIGLVVAVIFWWFYRDSPRQQPACNDAEIALIDGSDGEGGFTRSTPVAYAPGSPHAPGSPSASRVKREGGLKFRYLLTSPSLWSISLVQLLTNFAWIFLITWLPRFLYEIHTVPVIERGWMTSMPIMVGIIGMFTGGWLTDAMVRKLGRRWGRSLPLSLSRFVVAIGFILCMALNDPWTVTFAFCLVALSTDLGTPSVWAYSLDTGGKHVGAVLGWSNMFGNIGAALAPRIHNAIVESFTDPREGWQAMFLTCACVMVLAGILALSIDATKRIVPEQAQG
ncbi:MAG: MFS transporter [Planctomycetes bacterium]|nr:MFS transporter [Planctomycetota bacterium]